jgi:hypothetical protein
MLERRNFAEDRQREFTPAAGTRAGKSGQMAVPLGVLELPNSVQSLNVPTSVPATCDLPFQFWHYSRDVWERSVLFWDTLRQRADNMLEHERAGQPPLLDFKYEILLDARRFDRPANYALLRIPEVGDLCWKTVSTPTNRQ